MSMEEAFNNPNGKLTTELKLPGDRMWHIAEHAEIVLKKRRHLDYAFNDDTIRVIMKTTCQDIKGKTKAEWPVERIKVFYKNGKFPDAVPQVPVK
jgi:hypothetical protein